MRRLVLQNFLHEAQKGTSFLGRAASSGAAAPVAAPAASLGASPYAAPGPAPAAAPTAATDTSSADLPSPAYESYAPQSGEIFGILEQMQENFEDHLDEIAKTEDKAIEAFAQLEEAKLEQIEGHKADIVDFESRLANSDQKFADDTKSQGEAETQLASDETFLENTKTTRKAQNEEYDTRSKDRLAELSAVESAISTLDSDKSLNVFGKTTSFLQISRAEARGQQTRRLSAAAKLKRVADATHSSRLSLLASRVQIDDFKAVKKAISAMVNEMTEQQADEVEKKAWCLKEIADNDAAIETAKNTASTLEVARDQLAVTVNTLQSDIDTLEAAVVATKTDMKTAAKTRAEAEADYKQAIADQQMMQTILGKAINTLKKVYSLMQEKHGHGRHRAHTTSATTSVVTSDPPQFTTYTKNSGSTTVITMLEAILADAKAAEEDAEKAEETSVADYETYVTDSEADLKTKASTISTKSGERATADEELITAKKDIVATAKKLKNLNAESVDLHKSCDFLIDNFQTRQDSREAELYGMNAALTALAGNSTA
jgi:hypothetical protein